MELHPVIKKLQWKNQADSVLILGAPKEYEEVMFNFEGEVHTDPQNERYEFIQIFGTSNQSIKDRAIDVVELIGEDSLLWLCYPKKSSKKYKGLDCSRETVGSLLGDFGYEPVRQIAIDEDWSALRFRPVNKIKKMTRTFAVTEAGKERTKKDTRGS